MLSRWKEVEADQKAIQEIEFVEQLRNTNGIIASGSKSMLVLTILAKKV